MQQLIHIPIRRYKEAIYRDPNQFQRSGICPTCKTHLGLKLNCWGKAVIQVVQLQIAPSTRWLHHCWIFLHWSLGCPWSLWLLCWVCFIHFVQLSGVACSSFVASRMQNWPLAVERRRDDICMTAVPRTAWLDFPCRFSPPILHSKSAFMPYISSAYLNHSSHKKLIFEEEWITVCITLFNRNMPKQVHTYARAHTSQAYSKQ